MAKKNNQTAGEAAQAQAVQGQAATQPATPGAAPATPATAAEDEAADDEHDSEEEGDEPTDDQEKVQLRELVRQLRADNSELQQQLTDERQRSGDLGGELNESEKLVEQLQSQLKRADARQADSGAVIVSHGEVDYKVLAPNFQFEGKKYRAADLADDPALVARLVAAEVGFLHPINAGE